MMQLFKNSGEHGVSIQRKPELKVYATRACAKGKLELVSFSNTLHVVKGHEKSPPNGMPRAGCLGYEAKGVGYTIFMKPTLVFPKQQKNETRWPAQVLRASPAFGRCARRRRRVAPTCST